MTAFYRYGSYDFEAGECDLVRVNVTNRMSPRGNRVIREVTHFIRALVCKDTQADLSAEIEAIQLAFSNDFQNAGLWLDSSTPSKHLLDNDDVFNISGTRVLQRSFPEGGGDEYNTARTFSATIQALYDDADSHLLEWQESLEFTGTTGPTFEWRPGWFAPYREQTSEQSIQYIIQRGSALGYGAYVIEPPPLFPAYEHVERRNVKYGTPAFMGRQFRNFPTEWVYYFSSNTPLSGTPTLR